METPTDETDLLEITIEVPSALLATAQDETREGIQETVIEGLQKLLRKAPAAPASKLDL